MRPRFLGHPRQRAIVPSVVEMEPEEESSEQTLIRALEEYKLLKEESAKLKELETIGYFYKEPDKNVGEAKIVYKDFNLDGLLKAFTELMIRQEALSREKGVQREIPKDVYTIPDRANYICDTVKERGTVGFDELFTPYSSKNEIITTFQALLELLKYQFIKVEQGGVFEKILIKYNTERSEDETIGDLGEFE